MDNGVAKPSGWRKLLEVMIEEVHGIHPRLIALNIAASFLPRRNAAHARSRVFSLAGFRIGDKTRLHGNPRINGAQTLFSNLIVGEDCSVDADCAFDLEERITIGDRVTIGPGVMILTSTHELDKREHRAGPVHRSPVVIQDGAWIGARSILLPGVTIGAGSIVNAGAVVNKDVAPNTRVGGIPATQLETLSTNEASDS
jgi:maltose O-acetyltransferase